MKIKSEGLINTDDRCIGCNSCILSCPITGANRTVRISQQNRLVVDPDRCVRCGHCIRSCSHNARDYMDDTQEFLYELEKGTKVALIVSSSFALSYPSVYGKILNYLLSRGVSSVYDEGFGGHISTWATLKYLDRHPEGGFLSSNCAVVVNYIEQNTVDGTKYLLPVQSPTMCMGTYIRRYLKDDSRLAYLGSCPAKKDEFEQPCTKGTINYNVTYKKLFEAIEKSDYDSFSNDIELKCSYPWNIFYLYGGVKESLSRYLDPDKMILSVRDASVHYSNLGRLREEIFHDGEGPYIIDIQNCEHGCVTGPVVEKKDVVTVRIWQDYKSGLDKLRGLKDDPISEDRTPSQRKEALYGYFRELDENLFMRRFSDRYHQEYEVPDAIIEEIFRYMKKLTPEQKNMDCHACGYGSCREMAKAIALGINRRENCVSYEKYINEKMIMTDTLTGIPNMQCFNAKIRQLRLRGKLNRFAIAIFEMIDSELMYARYGYDEVDKCIAEYAREAGSFISEGELLSRTGGTGFIALLNKEHVDNFLMDMNQIVVHPTVGHHDDKFIVNIYAGIYLPEAEEALGSIIGKATVAMKSAKNRNTPCCIYYDDAMRAGTLESAYLTKAFNDGLSNREFVVFYQPKVSLKTMRLVGTEALVRWVHSGELISPGRFIPVFERNGYVEHVDFYVLDQVCRDLKSWLDEGYEPVRVSSNFSKRHIKKEGLVEQILEVVDKYGIPHELIEIEFTESTAADECEKLAQILRELKANGIKTSIDDFGSGFSSLNMLQNMEFGVLKIDKGFLDAGINDTKSRKIICSIIRMAKDIGMEVVAEGVEKREELTFLQENDCDMIQGYYFDKPMTMNEYKLRLENPVYDITD